MTVRCARRCTSAHDPACICDAAIPYAAYALSDSYQGLALHNGSVRTRADWKAGVVYRATHEHIVSKAMQTKSIKPPAIQARKGGQPIVCLTSFTAPMTRLVDPHNDLILVGDSLAMTIYGAASTVGVT